MSSKLNVNNPTFPSMSKSKLLSLGGVVSSTNITTCKAIEDSTAAALLPATSLSDSASIER